MSSDTICFLLDDSDRRIQFCEQMMNVMNWAVIVIKLTITLIGCEKLILSSRKNSMYGLESIEYWSQYSWMVIEQHILRCFKRISCQR
jgi:hypothetical protein